MWISLDIYRPVHVVGGDEFVGERVDLLLGEGDALVLELHRVLDAGELRGGDDVRAVVVAVVERLTRDKGVDQIAVERVCYLLE